MKEFKEDVNKLINGESKWNFDSNKKGVVTESKKILVAESFYGEERNQISIEDFLGAINHLISYFPNCKLQFKHDIGYDYCDWDIFLEITRTRQENEGEKPGEVEIKELVSA
jgi:hypothetical protein